jgi:hypothetical protein
MFQTIAQFCHTTESGPNLPYNTCFSDIKESNSTYLWNKIGEESISNFFNAYSVTKKGLTQCQNGEGAIGRMIVSR